MLVNTMRKVMRTPLHQLGRRSMGMQYKGKMSNHGFPHPHKDFTRVLDEEVDTNCEDYLRNYEAME
jgi:hypothetical protein